MSSALGTPATRGAPPLHHLGNLKAGSTPGERRQRPQVPMNGAACPTGVLLQCLNTRIGSLGGAGSADGVDRRHARLDRRHSWRLRRREVTQLVPHDVVVAVEQGGGARAPVFRRRSGLGVLQLALHETAGKETGVEAEELPRGRDKRQAPACLAAIWLLISWKVF